MDVDEAWKVYQALIADGGLLSVHSPSVKGREHMHVHVDTSKSTRFDGALVFFCTRHFGYLATPLSQSRQKETV